MATAVGAALVVVAYHQANTESIGSYDPLFWAGLMLGYVALGWRAICGGYPTIWLGLLGAFTLLPKYLMSISGPIYFDETAHFALLRQVVATGHLFQYSPLLPIGTDYPGLEAVTAAVHWLTGLPPWTSALVLIAVVHTLVPAQVFYIARRLSFTPRLAATAGILYAANPSFVYEDVQFAYETLAMLFMLTLMRLYLSGLTCRLRARRAGRQTSALLTLIALLSAALVVTHHLTALSALFLVLLAALFVQHPTGASDHDSVLPRALLRWTPIGMLGLLLGAWVAFVAPGTVPYLLPHVAAPTSMVLHAVGIGGAGHLSLFRKLFSHSTIPIYERIAALAAPVIIGLLWLVGAIGWLRSRRQGSTPLWPLALAATYLVSLPLTLLAEGAAGAHRTWASTFVGVSVLPATVALLFRWRRRPPRTRRLWVAAWVIALAVILMGNIAAGTPTDYRFPGPYKFGSDTLSQTAETDVFAHWVRRHLGPNANIVTDRFTAVALTGRAGAITPLQVPGLPLAEIWYNPRPPDPLLMYAMRRLGTRFLAVDVRDAQHSSLVAPLFVPGLPPRVPERNLARLEHWPWLKLLYSSKHYRLYRINYNSYFTWYPFHANNH